MSAHPTPETTSSALDGAPGGIHPAACRACIDAVLAALAYRHREVADHLLDLKLDTTRRRNPGGCVGLYFEVLGRLPRGQVGAEMAQVRAWLESLIEVVAYPLEKAAAQRHPEPMARVPMALGQAASLEEYCTGVMGQFRRARRAQPRDLQLRFAYLRAA